MEQAFGLLHDFITSTCWQHFLYNQSVPKIRAQARSSPLVLSKRRTQCDWLRVFEPAVRQNSTLIDTFVEQWLRFTRSPLAVSGFVFLAPPIDTLQCRRRIWLRFTKSPLAAAGFVLLNAESTELDTIRRLPQNLGRVEEGRGPGTYWQPCISLPRSANRTCRFPASGFPTVFTIQTHAVAPAPTFLKRNTSNFSAIPLINYANIISYLEHRITNAASESLNAKIQWVKYTARASATSRTSSTRSTSTAVDWISPLHPLNSLKRQQCRRWCTSL